MPDNSVRIAEIEEILRSGVSHSTVDGVSTQFDFDSLRTELRQLRDSDTSETAQTGRRPVASRINLGGF